MTRVMAGPFASLMLSDLGAEVVKVEAKGGGDVMRYMGGQATVSFHKASLDPKW